MFIISVVITYDDSGTLETTSEEEPPRNTHQASQEFVEAAKVLLLKFNAMQRTAGFRALGFRVLAFCRVYGFWGFWYQGLVLRGI